MGILDAPSLTPTRATQLFTPRTARSERYREQFLQPVCNRTSVAPATLGSTNGGPGRSNGTHMAGMYRTFYTSLVPFHAPRLIYANIINNNGLEAPGANPITISASIELPSGAGSGLYRVTFNGQPTVTIQPGAIVMSDPIGWSSGPANLPNWYVRTYVSVATSGMTWPLMLRAVGLDRAESADTGITDKTLSGTIALTQDRMYGPAAIVGVPEVETPSVAIVGDSIAAGYNDLGQNSFLAQALDSLGVPYVNLAAGSESTARWSLPQFRMLRAPLLRFCTHAIFEDGFNSLGTTWAGASGVEDNQRKAWAYLASMGLTLAQTTITPGTTSTDSWATSANQTVLASPQEDNRTLLNTLIRTVPAPLTACIEAADTAMTARNSGIWKSDGTAGKWSSDGAHPSPYAHTQLATAVAPQIAAWLAANPK